MSDAGDRPSHLDANCDPIPLSRHHRHVADRARALVPEDARTPDGASLRELTERVALVHDAGKLTTWFRQHLHDEDPDGPKHHAPLGALLAHYVLDAIGFEGEDPLVGFVAVAKHHGSLPDVGGYVYEAASGREPGRLQQYYHDHARAQVDDIDESVPGLAGEVVRRATDGTGSWAEFRERVENGGVFDDVTCHVARPPHFLNQKPDPVSDDFYATVLQVWSALVFADKTSAASLTTGVPLDEEAYRSPTPGREVVEEHVQCLQQAAVGDNASERERNLNARREEARQSVRARTETFLESDHPVATLTLPTGLGKTLTGLDAALTILNESEAEDGRVVYALPFTSIVDQVAAETRELLDAETHGDRLTVDHHLAETVIEPDEDAAEEVDDDDIAHVAELLGESWRSSLVVTTFVQLFESLAGPKNSRAMKLPSLYGSVVILDEPQALPLDWWKLIRRLTGLLTEEYGATVIAMTATQPHLFDGGGQEPFELVEDRGRYYEGLDRVEFDLHRSARTYLDGDPEPVTYRTAAESVADVLSESRSALAICNTIDSARELTGALTEAIEVVEANETYGALLAECEGMTGSVEAEHVVETLLDAQFADQPVLVHLTTRHRPCDRRTLIDVASTLADGGYPVALVSTQLVEAGVDVSFDHVFRDFAPMDSIVQAAGRCNRSFDRWQGTVTISLLEPPEGRESLPANVVYDHGGESLTRMTALALDEVWEGEPMPERTVTRDAVLDYFDRLADRNVGNSEYVDYLNKGEIGKLGGLSLIDERPAVDVVVARTREEWKLVREIRAAFGNGEWKRLDELVDRTREWSVSVPLYAGNDRAGEKLVDCTPVHPGAELRRLDGREGNHAGFFDATRGFVIPDSTVEARLL